MPNESPKDSKTSFWSTLPGLLTAVAGTIGAIATLVTALNSAGVFRGPQAAAPPGRPVDTAALAPAPLPQPAAPSATAAPGPPGRAASGGAEVDRTSAAATAAAVLRVFKARDVVALAGLSHADNRKIFAGLVEQGERHPRYRSIFSGWRWQAAQAWQGHIGETRYRNLEHLEALVAFGEMKSDREVETLVVVLQWIDGKWAFEDINSPDRAQFESFRPTR